MKLKILHILHSLQVGGLENGVVNLINRLDHDRFEHAICCIDTSGPMAERMERPVEICALGKGSGGDHMLPLKLARVIRKIRPDIVHTRNWGTIDGVIGARLAGVRYIIHGEHGREATDPTGANRRRLRARRLLHPMVTRFMAVSADLKQWLLNDVKVPEGKVVQIINGVDTDRFKPADDKAAAKTAMGLTPDSFVIGTVGRLDPVKDQQTLVRAFADLITNKTSSTSNADKTALLIIGSGSEEANLKKMARYLDIIDRVYFLGSLKNIPEIMQAMDVFVLPSIAEGISNTILEAMACGLPVVATRVGGTPELVEEGISGIMFDAGNYPDLANILAGYMQNPSSLAQHAAGGRERALNEFSLSRMIKEYEYLYSSIRQVR